jgi:hypothetical protein
MGVSTGKFNSECSRVVLLSHVGSRADGVFMGPPFLAYYGALRNNQSLLQLAYDNCRLYRDALLIDGPTGPLWAHIYDDDTQSWVDMGIWGTGKIIIILTTSVIYFGSSTKVWAGLRLA